MAGQDLVAFALLRSVLLTGPVDLISKCRPRLISKSYLLRVANDEVT